jgi:hypothetical protein
MFFLWCYMKKKELDFLTEIPESERKGFDEYIRNARKTFIQSPKVTVKIVLESNSNLMLALQGKEGVSDVIKTLREEAFTLFLIQESQMNAFLLKHISEKFEVPKEAFEQLCNVFDESNETLKHKLREFFGDYAGKIYPYIYRLSLSNTQSRRSRAGKVFEGIVYGLYDVLGYPYESQATVGSKNFKTQRLGKIVDSLLPNLESFEQRRDKVIIGTMKTTLRERWQEVIEEINRTGIPSIYLLTADEEISVPKVEQMANHNVILVVYHSVKNSEKLKNKRNVVSFEDYFFDEIPQILKYWQN